MAEYSAGGTAQLILQMVENQGATHGELTDGFRDRTNNKTCLQRRRSIWFMLKAMVSHDLLAHDRGFYTITIEGREALRTLRGGANVHIHYGEPSVRVFATAKLLRPVDEECSGAPSP